MKSKSKLTEAEKLAVRGTVIAGLLMKERRDLFSASYMDGYWSALRAMCVMLPEVRMTVWARRKFDRALQAGKRKAIA